METPEPACAGTCSSLGDGGLGTTDAGTEIVFATGEQCAYAVMAGASDQVERVGEADADG